MLYYKQKQTFQMIVTFSFKSFRLWSGIKTFQFLKMLETASKYNTPF